MSFFKKVGKAIANFFSNVAGYFGHTWKNWKNYF